MLSKPSGAYSFFAFSQWELIRGGLFEGLDILAKTNYRKIAHFSSNQYGKGYLKKKHFRVILRKVSLFEVLRHSSSLLFWSDRSSQLYHSIKSRSIKIWLSPGAYSLFAYSRGGGLFDWRGLICWPIFSKIGHFSSILGVHFYEKQQFFVKNLHVL